MASAGQLGTTGQYEATTDLPAQADVETLMKVAGVQPEIYQPPGKATRLTMLIVWMMSLKNQRMRNRVGRSYARRQRPTPQQGV